MSIFSDKAVRPFNSPFETGLRSLCILTVDVDVDVTLDLQQLTAFDHLVVHTGDFEGAPASLHPDTPQRNGELIVRRELVERGLRLMESRKLVSKSLTSAGFSYSSTELAAVLLDSLASTYLIELRLRSAWVIEHYLSYGDRAFSVIFDQAFDRWSAEFQFEQITYANTRHEH